MEGAWIGFAVSCLMTVMIMMINPEWLARTRLGRLMGRVFDRLAQFMARLLEGRRG